jgi:hypothetical protein
MIEQQHQQDAADAELAAKQAEDEKAEAKRQAEEAKAAKQTSTSRRKTKSPFDDVIETASNQVGREIGRQIVRGLLGSLKR